MTEDFPYSVYLLRHITYARNVIMKTDTYFTPFSGRNWRTTSAVRHISLS